MLCPSVAPTDGHTAIVIYLIFPSNQFIEQPGKPWLTLEEAQGSPLQKSFTKRSSFVECEQHGLCHRVMFPKVIIANPDILIFCWIQLYHRVRYLPTKYLPTKIFWTSLRHNVSLLLLTSNITQCFFSFGSGRLSKFILIEAMKTSGWGYSRSFKKIITFFHFKGNKILIDPQSKPCDLSVMELRGIRIITSGLINATSVASNNFGMSNVWRKEPQPLSQGTANTGAGITPAQRNGVELCLFVCTFSWLGSLWRVADA